MGELTNERLDELIAECDYAKQSAYWRDVQSALRELRSLRRRDYVLVPRDATRPMLVAGGNVLKPHLDDPINNLSAAGAAYRAMLAAAEQTGRPDTGGLPHVGPSDSQ